MFNIFKNCSRRPSLKDFFRDEKIANIDIFSYMILFIKNTILQSSGDIIIYSEQFSSLKSFEQKY